MNNIKLEVMTTHENKIKTTLRNYKFIKTIGEGTFGKVKI